jgi:hypothetical protein
MKKNPIPVIIPVIAIIIALMLLTCFGGSPNAHEVYSIVNKGGSYFLVGNRNKVESVKLSDGKELTWDKQSGELVYCMTEDGINRITVTWSRGEELSDTVISTDNNMQQIVLDHSLIQSNISFDCPLEPLEFGDFTVNGPDKDCNYSLIIRPSFKNKGYEDSSVLVSLTGKSGKYSKIDRWERMNSGQMDVWVKVGDQKIMITPGRTYSTCKKFKCDQKTKDSLIAAVRSDLVAVLSSPEDIDKLITKRTLEFINKGVQVEKNTFIQEVEVNYVNQKLGLPNNIQIKSITIEDDCETFKIVYEN